MASVQAAPGVPGAGQLPANVTKEVVQAAYTVRIPPGSGLLLDRLCHCALHCTHSNMCVEVPSDETERCP